MTLPPPKAMSPTADNSAGGRSAGRTPTGPSGPSGPSTGGPDQAAGPSTGGGAPRAASPGPRGATITLTHGHTVQGLLQIAWDHAVFAAPRQTSGTQALPGPMTPEAAIAYIAGSDKRPLLVLRECAGCRGTDLALLRTDASNERTLLLTRFFHCVRLPANAAAEGHAFSRLLTGHNHLLLCDSDGSDRVDFSGSQSQSELIQTMRKAIERNHGIDATGALNELQKALAQMDRIDAQEADTMLAIDKALDQRGGTARVVELQQRGQALVAERKAVLARIAELGGSSR